jgi:hypothetical protein
VVGVTLDAAGAELDLKSIDQPALFDLDGELAAQPLARD